MGPFALLALGAGALKTGVDAYSAYQSSKATKQAYEIQAQVDQTNAMLAGVRAEDAVTRGNLAVQKLHRGYERARHSAKASRAASGVALDMGSTLAVYAGVDAIEAIDKATLKQNAAREEFGYKIQQSNYQQAAVLKRNRAAQEKPGMAAFSTLLGGASQLASSAAAMG